MSVSNNYLANIKQNYLNIDCPRGSHFLIEIHS